jgi:hypothetical protein
MKITKIQRCQRSLKRYAVHFDDGSEIATSKAELQNYGISQAEYSPASALSAVRYRPIVQIAHC